MRIVLLFTISILFAFGLRAQSSVEDRLDQALNAFQEGNYDISSDSYLALIEEGYVSSELYYNLANCYSKLEDVPRAILYYEKALKLRPNDSNVLHNLNLVNQEISDEIGVVPDFFLKRYWEGFCMVLSANVWVLMLYTFLVILIISTYFWLFGKERNYRKFGFSLVVVSLILILLSLFASRTKTKLEYGSNEAIVMESNLYLKSGPDEKSNDIRRLLPGLKVSILDQIGRWYKVELPNNEPGWVLEENLEII